MKRLVTQFDDKRLRATVATPTCCCCCCCVASVLTSTALSALNVHELAAKVDMPESRRWLLRVVALTALPLAVAASVAAAWLMSLASDELAWLAGVAAFFGAWTAILAAAYKPLRPRSRGAIVAFTVIVSTLIFCGEFILGAAMIGDDSDGSGWGYLAVALIAPFVLVPLLRTLTPGR